VTARDMAAANASIQTRQIASLPMYNIPQLADANRALWGHIRRKLEDAGIAAPVKLSNTILDDSLHALADLCFTQTCREPYRRFLAPHVSLVGTPDYGVADCRPGYYRSAIVVRRDSGRTHSCELDGAVAAVNCRHSWSGFRALKRFARKDGIRFSDKVFTGSHHASVNAVVAGVADIAAVDVVLMRYSLMLERDSPFAGVRQLALTERSPGLPYVAMAGIDRRTWFDAVREAIHDLPNSAQARLGIRDLVWIPERCYLAED